MIVIDKGLKVASILTLALKEYSNYELEFIGTYLIDLKDFTSDISMAGASFNSRESIDILSCDLADFTAVGQPVYLLSGYAFELLDNKGYDVSIFNNYSILELLNVTTRCDELDINAEIIPILRAVLSKALNNLSIDQLNDFYLKFASWNKCDLSIDYIFKYKEAFYILDVNSKNTYILNDKNGLKEFNSDFIEVCDLSDLIGCIDILNDIKDVI